MCHGEHSPGIGCCVFESLIYSGFGGSCLDIPMGYVNSQTLVGNFPRASG